MSTGKRKSDTSSKRQMIYKVKFVTPGMILGVKNFKNYKAALQEAESWVLSGKDYTSIVEWTTFTGDKSVTFDYYTVQEQRRARNTYKKLIKENLVRKAYVEL